MKHTCRSSTKLETRVQYNPTQVISNSRVARKFRLISQIKLKNTRMSALSCINLAMGCTVIECKVDIHVMCIYNNYMHSAQFVFIEREVAESQDQKQICK